MMKFFDYIFFRTYANTYKSKHKNVAEARSIQFVLMYLVSIIFSIIMILNKIFLIHEYYPIDKSKLLIYVLPVVWIVWHFVEKHYRKFSQNNYEIIMIKFKKNKYNKIIPFWLIFIFPLTLFIIVPFVLLLF